MVAIPREVFLLATPPRRSGDGRRGVRSQFLMRSFPLGPKVELARERHSNVAIPQEVSRAPDGPGKTTCFPLMALVGVFERNHTPHASALPGRHSLPHLRTQRG